MSSPLLSASTAEVQLCKALIPQLTASSVCVCVCADRLNAEGIKWIGSISVNMTNVWLIKSSNGCSIIVL